MKLVHHERLENALKNLKVKLSTLGASLQKYLLTGVIAIVPTAVTLYIIYYIFKFTDSFLGNTLSEALGFSLPGMGIFVTALICLLVGFLAQYYFGQKIISGLDNSLNNIPVVKSVYSSIKQVADVFINNSKDNFKRVVMLEFPKENSWAIGFVSSDFLLKVDADIPEKDAMITVFVPTTPNPTSGYLIIVPKTKVIDLDISIEDAMKIIVSGGLVQPVKAVETDETAKLEDSKIPEGTKLLEEHKEPVELEICEKSEITEKIGIAESSDTTEDTVVSVVPKKPEESKKVKQPRKTKGSSKTKDSKKTEKTGKSKDTRN